MPAPLKWNSGACPHPLPLPSARRSREACNEGEGDPPLYVNVDMFSGRLMNTWMDSLQAFFPGLQVPPPPGHPVGALSPAHGPAPSGSGEQWQDVSRSFFLLVEVVPQC